MCREEVRDCGKVGYIALGLPVEELIVRKSDYYLGNSKGVWRGLGVLARYSE